MPEIVLLTTDALIFLLVILVLVFAVYAARREHLRAPWRQVGRSKVGMGALLVLICYVAIGLMDSMHFRPVNSAESRQTAEMLSLLDWWLTPLRTRHEKTYSAPLATHQYTKENIEQEDGTSRRDYPRLVYGGAHLKDVEREWTGDLILKSLSGLFKGFICWSMAALLVLIWRARVRKISPIQLYGDIWRDRADIPWRVVWMTAGVISLLGFWAAELASHYHLLGTDKVGEDVFYQALKSVRTGLLIGTLTTLVMLPAAILLGIMAGYFRGWVDDLIQYTYTTLNSIPGVLLIAAAILMMQIYMSNHPEQFDSLVQRADLRLLFLCMILGVTSWTGLCRMLRGETFKLREMEYVQAAQAFGVGHFTVIGRHILPNLLHIVLITLVLDFSGLVLAEAVLSYVNIGVDPTMNSWGNMINSARLEMARDPIVWWSLAAALFFMFTLVLSANLFSDVVRDAFDPRLRARR
jgi:peptide/nickel transport system permease protein